MGSAGEFLRELSMQTQWADILGSLTEKRSSIEGAATFALERPCNATEFLAAIVASAEVQTCQRKHTIHTLCVTHNTVSQSADHAKRMAPLYVIHDICQRCVSENTPAAFLNAA